MSITFDHHFFDSKTIFMITAGFMFGLLVSGKIYMMQIPSLEKKSFDAGFRQGQWNGFYYSGNLEDAAAAQVHLEDLGEWKD